MSFHPFRKHWRTTIARASGVAGALLLLALSLTGGGVHGAVLLQQPWTFTYPRPVLLVNASGGRTAQFYPPTTNNHLLRLGANGSATQNFFGGESIYGVRINASQAFTLSQQSVVQIPLYFRGTQSFFGSGTNNSYGMEAGGFDILNSAGQHVGSNTYSLSGPASAGDQAANLATVRYVTLPAGSYTFRGFMEVTGRTGDGSRTTGVTADFLSGTNGAASVLGAWPTGLPGSRAFVRAPTARQKYGVTGTGVLVGQIEPGRPYIVGDPIRPNSALNGRVMLVNSPAANNVNYRDEHAEAVASIIAGANANTENAGVAPGAQIISAAESSYAGNATAQFRSSLQALLAQHVTVINMSAHLGQANGSDSSNNAAYLDQVISNNPNLLFVKSAGNNGGNVTAPGTAYNGLAVGALNATFTRLAPFSSRGSTIGGLNPFKPDLVAPGTYINAAAAVGNGFTRAFTGETFDAVDPATGRAIPPLTGPTTGTSFAAPFVAGAGALLDNYYANHRADHSMDHRVLKAVLMNSANVGVAETDGTSWTAAYNARTSGDATPGDPLIVSRSLDPQLGAGALNVSQALAQYAPAESSGATGNIQQHLTVATTLGKAIWWDGATVHAVNGADPGSVDYLLGHVSGHVRITLNWDAISNGVSDAAEQIPDMRLLIYAEGVNAGNARGFGPGDMLIAQAAALQTGGPSNVDLLDFNLPQYNAVGPFANPFAGQYYVSVEDFSPVAVQYGIAAIVPVPEMHTILVVASGLSILLLRFALAQRAAA